jgi:hypothetical protein
MSAEESDQQIANRARSGGSIDMLMSTTIPITRYSP